MNRTVIYNANLVMPERIISDGYVVFEGSKIIEVGNGKDFSSFNGEKINANEKFLSPGFVDIHCHGGGGSDFMDGTEEAFIIPAKKHAEHGTTSIMPTTLTSTNEELIKCFEIFDCVKNKETGGAKFIGLHLEGPYFSVNQKGAQDERYIKEPKPEEYEEIFRLSKGNIKRWSAAPELNGAAKFGAFLKSKGILASIGHSDATYEDVVSAYENGFNLITHLYSGMSTITRVKGYRKLGVIESAFVIEGMKVEVIADGHHLPKELLKIVYKFKGSENVALVTDSMRAAGMGDGESILGSLKDGQKVFVENGVAKLMDLSAFAGSVCTTDRLVRTMYKDVEVPLYEAVKMASLVPARMVNLEKEIGSIASGKDADLVLFDDDINIIMTIVKGKVVYKK